MCFDFVWLWGRALREHLFKFPSDARQNGGWGGQGHLAGVHLTGGPKTAKTVLVVQRFKVLLRSVKRFPEHVYTQLFTLYRSKVGPGAI